MNNPPLLLIYLNFKGLGQIIRHLLRYLNVPFTEIFLDQYQQQKKTLSLEVKQALKGKAINKNEIPAIIHNNEIIYESTRIMAYICIAFDREDLLGINIYQKAHVCEFLEIFERKVRANVFYLFKFVGQIQSGSFEGQELLAFLDQKFNYLLNESGYFMELCNYYRGRSRQQFVLGDFTVMDFFFVEMCRFCILLFGNISVQLASKNWIQHAKALEAKKQMKDEANRTCQALTIMKAYLNFYQGHEFYHKDRAYLESFKYFPYLRASEGYQQACKQVKSIDFLEVLYNRRPSLQ